MKSKNKIKLKNLYLGLKDQGPFKRFWRNFFITKNGRGMFHINSHIVARTGKLKVMYNTRKSAEKAAASMEKKYDGIFRPYKCIL